MNFLKKILKHNSSKPAQRIKLSPDNISLWVKYQDLLKEDKVKFDAKGQLRYPHGAPVGDLILTRVHKDGTPVYQESAEEWFDPGSKKANDFIWP